MNNPFKILFKYPTRSRPDRFFAGMDSIYNNLNDRQNFSVLITADTDDHTMNNDEVKARIKTYPNAFVIYGESQSKIHAINRDFDIEGEWSDFDILICMSDDMRFNLYGFDDVVRVDQNAIFPDFDGLLHYYDADTKGALATMYIAGRKFFDRFGYIYHPSYKSLWCDNEIEECAKLLGKWHYTGYMIYQHLNPAYGHLERDDMFNVQQGYWGEDERNYYERKSRNFDLIIQ
jgi:hypothetical protein